MSNQDRPRYIFTVIRERMQQHPGPVLNFAVGDLSRELPDAVLELTRLGAPLTTRRASPAEIRDFTRDACDWLKSIYGIEVQPTNILPAGGGRAAMTALVACVLEPGDGVVVTEPSYPAFARVASHHHACVHVAPLDPQRAFLPALDGLGARGTTAIRLVGLNYPNNPTGAILGSETVDLLADRLPSTATIFNDATYGPLTFEGGARSLLAYADRFATQQSLIELHSFGKLFALGPLATAFLIGSESLIESIRHYSDFAWTPLSALQVQVANSCVRELTYLEETRSFFRGRLDALRDTLAALGFQLYPTPGGVYQMTRPPIAVGDRETPTAEAAANELFDRFGLALVAWDLPPNGYLRFTSLYSSEDLDGLRSLAGRLELAY